MISIAVGTGVGVNAVLSRSLGERDAKMADESAKNGIFLAFVSCVVFAVLGVLLAKPFSICRLLTRRSGNMGSSI